jgi:transposase
VPIAYRSTDGNTSDDTTHVQIWDSLRALVGTSAFTYVADSKLCSAQTMGHYARAGGKFITIVPRRRREDTWLRDYAQRHTPQ